MENVKSLYLYPTHDSDLCGLLKEAGLKGFRDIAKDALRVLTRPGYVPKVVIPEFKPSLEDEYEKVKMVRLSIQSKKDEDIRELISHVKPRQFNGFIKTAMRFYIGVIPTLSCMLDMELIKTVPVYTPNGVIVFPNTVDRVNFSTKKKSVKQKKDTIKKANDVITRTVKRNSTIKETEENLEKNNKDEIKSFNSQSENSIPDNTSFNDTGINNTEIDVLSLLENLLD